MADPADDPLPKPITDEAARWIAAAEGDALSAEEGIARDTWLAADARHARAFTEMQNIWAHMGGVPEIPSLRASLPPPGRRSRRSTPRAIGPRRHRWIGPALAASLALVFIGIAEDLPTRLRADEMTATGERRVVKLPDGSTVHLDTRSAIAFDFGRDRRVVRLLSGEAAFTVAPDRRRPFTVEASGGSATALGTRFLVRKDDGGASVTVTEHSVRVAYPAPQGPAAVVAEGQSLAYGTGGIRQAAPANTADAMAWTEGVLVFKDKPLAQVVAQIGRYHRGYVRVLGEAQALRISGVSLLPLASLPETPPKPKEAPKPTEKQEKTPTPPKVDPVTRPIAPIATTTPAPQPQPVATPAPTPPQAETAAPKTAPAPPAPQVSSNAPDTWEGRVLARLEKFRRYPGTARSARQQGVAYIRFRINRDGHVLSSSLARSSGFPVLDQAALETLRRADPLPKIPPDRPDEMELSVPVEFFLR